MLCRRGADGLQIWDGGAQRYEPGSTAADWGCSFTTGDCVLGPSLLVPSALNCTPPPSPLIHLPVTASTTAAAAASACFADRPGQAVTAVTEKAALAASSLRWVLKPR